MKEKSEKKNEIFGYIYKITNLITGKIYIGKCSKKGNTNMYYGSGSYINRSIKKHGIENFKKEIIENCNDREELNKREIYWIEELKARNKNIGYNIAVGGEGGPLNKNKIFSMEWRENMSKSFKGKKKSEAHRKNIGNALKNRVFNDNTLKKMSKSRLNKINAKDCDGNYICVVNDDPRYLSGELVGARRDSKASIETRQKMSNSHKGNKSCEGKIWIHDTNMINKLIKKEELDVWINDGWIKGKFGHSETMIKYWSGKKRI
jgi:group I intron endonuclease